MPSHEIAPVCNDGQVLNHMVSSDSLKLCGAASPIDLPGGNGLRVLAGNTSPEIQLSAVRIGADGHIKMVLDSARSLVAESRRRLEAIEQASLDRRAARLKFDEAVQQLVGLTSCATADETRQTIDELHSRKAEAAAQLVASDAVVRQVGSGHYFQAIKAMYRFASLLKERCFQETDVIERRAFANSELVKLEKLFDDLPRSRQGVESPADNLSWRAAAGCEVERIVQLCSHLEQRLKQMDDRHDARLVKLLNQSVIRDAFALVTSGALLRQLPEFVMESLSASQKRILEGTRPEKVPCQQWSDVQTCAKLVDINSIAVVQEHIEAVYKECSIVFFDGNGQLIGQVGTDGRFRPKYFDVAAILKGFGRGGAGIDRLVGEKPAGWAVVAPKVRLSFSGYFELHKTGTNSKSAPVYAKEVLTTGGVLRDGVRNGLPASKLGNCDGMSGGLAPSRRGITSDGKLASFAARRLSAS